MRESIFEFEYLSTLSLAITYPRVIFRILYPTESHASKNVLIYCTTSSTNCQSLNRRFSVDMSALACPRLLPLFRCHHAALHAENSRTVSSVLRRSFVKRCSSVKLLQNWNCSNQQGVVDSQLRQQSLTRLSASLSSHSSKENKKTGDLSKEELAAIKHRTGEGPDPDPEPESDPSGEDPKKTLLQRFSAYTKNYWYVAIPLHLVTSTIYFGAFYYLASIGFSPIPLLENLGLLKEYLKSIEEWQYTTLAVAVVFQKLAAPLRLLTTLYCLKILVKRGKLPTTSEFFALMKKRRAAKKNK